MNYEIFTKDNRIVVKSKCQAKNDHFSTLYMGICYAIMDWCMMMSGDRATFQQRFNVNMFGTLNARFKCESFVVTLKEDVTHVPGNNTYVYDYEVTLESKEEAPQKSLLDILFRKALDFNSSTA